jgi:hypothetical protein
LTQHQFRNQSWSSRYGAMGDEAEEQFEIARAGKFARYGLNRPPINMGMVPPFLRYTPDYITSHGLVEVQGVGRDRILKIKKEKADALDLWHKEFALQMFIWDTTNKRHTFVPWEDLACVLPALEVDSFPEGKEYWKLNVDEWVWPD